MLNNRDAFLTMDLPDGRVVDVCPLLWGRATLGVSLDRLAGWYEHLWEYDTVDAALAAAKAWNGEGEPVGWTRDPHTGRRRPGGDPAKEYILP